MAAYDPASPPMMGCGHTANATLKGRDGEPDSPVCVICSGIVDGAHEIVETPSLDGREAECAYCKRRTPSRVGLAFFEHRPNLSVDRYYDGCKGWD